MSSPVKTKLTRPPRVTREALYDAMLDITSELEQEGYIPVLYHAGPLTLAAAVVEDNGENKIVVLNETDWETVNELVF